jgi:hypothetical protein
MRCMCAPQEAAGASLGTVASDRDTNIPTKLDGSEWLEFVGPSFANPTFGRRVHEHITLISYEQFVKWREVCRHTLQRPGCAVVRRVCQSY